MKSFGIALTAAALAGAALAHGPEDKKTIYDFSMKTIEGKSVSLKKFKGKVLVVVNVASKCGNTPQYKGLEDLYKNDKKKGVVVLGFPANNFGAQEPGTDGEIKEFCKLTYAVDFPMFSKISVKGDDEHELYKWLIANSDRPKDDIEWNFAKFVIGKDGKVFRRLSPRTTPESPEFKKAIEDAMAQ